MNLTIAPRGILQINDAKIRFRNFRGEGSKYNREGDRSFAILIDSEDIANALIEEGYNVKIKPPREEGDAPFMYLPVKVKFNGREPNIYLTSGSRTNILTEDIVGMVDDIDIASVDIDIRPYDWEVNGKNGRTAYLKAMDIVQNVDRFYERHSVSEYPEE